MRSKYKRGRGEAKVSRPGSFVASVCDSSADRQFIPAAAPSPPPTQGGAEARTTDDSSTPRITIQHRLGSLGCRACCLTGGWLGSTADGDGALQKLYNTVVKQTNTMDGGLVSRRQILPTTVQGITPDESKRQLTEPLLDSGDDIERPSRPFGRYNSGDEPAGGYNAMCFSGPAKPERILSHLL